MSTRPAQAEEIESLAQYDTGMGTNFETIRDALLEEVQEVAKELDVSYSPDPTSYDVFFDKGSSRAMLYAESWGGSPDILAEITAFECDENIDQRDGGSDNGREIRIGNDSVKVNEGSLRGAANYLERKRTKEGKY